VRAVNLIPAEQRSGARVGAGKSGGVAFAVLGVLATVAVLALLYGLAAHQVSSRRAEAASLEAKAAQAQAAAAELAPYASFIALREARQHAVETLVDSRFDWAHTFHEFGRVLPSDASLQTLTGTVGAASTSGGSSSASSSAASGAGAVASATPPGSVPVFTVTGCATTQDAVAQTMNRLRLIDGVASVVLVSSSKPNGVASAGSGGCEAAASFSLQVTFQPLPSTSAAAAAATTRSVANSSSAAGVNAPAAPASGTSGGTGALR
jgi:Tfp pilus assembly protein PilN